MRSGLTLLALSGILLVLTLSGYALFLKPMFLDGDEPSTSAPADETFCEKRRFPAGSEITPADVSVSVFNAGQTSGLASRVSADLVLVGFGLGVTGNAPAGTRVTRAEVWTNDPDDPAARLVASYFPGAELEVTSKKLADGVVVVVGDQFKELSTGLGSLDVSTEVTVCGPTEETSTS